MQNVSRIVIGIIGIVVLMIMFPMVMSSTHDIQTDQHTDTALALGGTPPAGTCVLTEDLWQDDTGSVISAVGDKPETLTITSYTPATHTLTVGGVTTSTTATVVYEIDGLTQYTGMGAIVGITPLLIWIGFLFVMFGSIYSGVRSKVG
jgi:hypothetical protein